MSAPTILMVSRCLGLAFSVAPKMFGRPMRMFPQAPLWLSTSLVLSRNFCGLVTLGSRKSAKRHIIIFNYNKITRYFASFDIFKCNRRCTERVFWYRAYFIYFSDGGAPKRRRARSNLPSNASSPLDVPEHIML